MKVREESENVGLKLSIQKTKIMASGPITSWQIDGETVETVTDFILGGSKITADGDCNHEIKRCLLLGRKVMTYQDSILKKQRHYFVNKGTSSQGCGFSSSHVRMWELDYKDSTEELMLLNCGVGKDSWESLDCKEIQPVHPKGNQSWIFIGKTDAEALVLWPPDSKNWLIGKDPDAGRLKVGGKRDNRGWDGWVASPTWWTWVWVSCRSWWWTGKPGMLQAMGSQRVRHDWATELNWLEGGSKRSYCNLCQRVFCLCLKYDCLQPMTLTNYLRYKNRHF